MDESDMTTSTLPSVLFVYFTYTGQTLKVVETMAEVMESRGCNVSLAPIEFTDPRYEERFEHFPMKHPLREVVGMIPAELRRRPATIGIPDAASSGDYDFVLVGAPTWWLSTSVPMRSFLESPSARQILKGKRFGAAVPCRRYWKHNIKTVRRLGTKAGGQYVDGIHFRYEGGQVRSLLSLLSFLGSGENQPRYHGVKIPPTNLREHHLEGARQFAGRIADQLRGTATSP
jgi:flavodoxin